MGNVTLSTASVPEGTCPAWIIDMWPELVALMNANLGGTFTVVNIGDDTPDPADRVYPWIRTVGGMPDKVYVYVSGSWMAKHPDFVGKVVMWEGNSANIATLDDGLAEPLSATTGPMWELVTQLAAKFPLGVGTLPSGIVIGVGTTGGEENHSLTVPELAPHLHAVGVKYREVGCNGDCSALQLDTANTAGLFSDSTGGAGTPPVVVPHNTMPPYYGIHFIRKTIRQYYRI